MSGEYNGSVQMLGLKLETIPGEDVTLTSADFYAGFLDAEGINYSSDHSQTGKKSDGTLLNTSNSYARTSAGTVPVKIEVLKADDPTVRPAYFDILEVAGFNTGVIEPGVNDNYEFYYDGRPTCQTATIASRAMSCNTDQFQKKLIGAVIADGMIAIEGSGAPLVFTGTASGAFPEPTNVTDEITPTDTDGNCIQATGIVGEIDGVLYNVTSLTVNTNLGAVIIPSWSTGDGTNISHFGLREGGETTMSMSAVVIAPGSTPDYAKLLSSTKSGQFSGENDDVKIIIEQVQFQDLQDNTDAVMIREHSAICGVFRVQLK